MNRDEAIWYYRLGGRTLGPVSWAEIEEIARDSVDAEHLQVARGGDAGWVSAADALAEHPELKAPEAAVPEPEPEPQARGASDEDWALLEEEPSGAAEEVLSEAAEERHTGRSVSRPAGQTHEPQLGPGAMTPEHGLGKWIGQAWTMVTGEISSFALGVLLAGLVTIVTLGICGPPLLAGIYVMALKRFRGEEISPGTVFEGFEYFLPAWGVMLLMVVASFVLTAPLSVPATVLAGQDGGGEIGAFLQMVANVWGQIVGLAIAAAMFYAMVLVVDRRLGTIDAVTGSWEATKLNFMSYVGMALVLQIIGSAGVLACCVGILITMPMVPCTEVAAYMYHFRNK